MHIGISRPPTPPHPIADVDGAAVAKIAEELGFESIFYGEHPITPANEGGNSVHSSGVPFFQDLLVMLARASAVTTRIKLGAGVFLIHEHQAVMLAKQLASLDYYSGGRLIIGQGLGWSRIECEVMGGNFDRRWTQTRESIELMKKLWTQEVTEHDGEFYKVPPVYLYPKPATKPWPPFLLTGPHWAHEGSLESPKMMRTFRRVVDVGDGWYPFFLGSDEIHNGPEILVQARKIFDELCADSGRDPSEIKITALLRAEIHDGDLSMPELVNRDTLRRYEDAGIERATITVPTIVSEENAREILTYLAERVL
jgi:probable F420-dependent oxidoreductase